jgi:putative cardiolipin synthase
VDVLTNAVEATDVPIVHAGYAPYRKPLLRAGVRLWELRAEAGAVRPRRDVTNLGSSGSTASGSGTALHAKTFTVDGERLFVGSFNFDPRSARLNTELGFIVESPRLTREMDETLERFVPALSYEPRLVDDELVWIERREGKEVRHDQEPGTTFLQRTGLRFLSALPIEWLL